jgi:hypothetical protein
MYSVGLRLESERLSWPSWKHGFYKKNFQVHTDCEYGKNVVYGFD